MSAPCDIILASASESRRRLLEAAGVRFEAVVANVDETAIKLEHGSNLAGFDALAADLANRKALAVAGRFPETLVIGADQILVIDGEVLNKPANREAARQQLLKLRGRAHALKTAVACVIDQAVLWSHIDTARLVMREFSEDYLDSYLAAEGDSVTQTVGGYRIEDRGIQLFSEICGDYFSILGLPLLPLLEFLRARGTIAA